MHLSRSALDNISKITPSRVIIFLPNNGLWVAAEVLVHFWVSALTGLGGERVSHGQFISFEVTPMGQSFVVSNGQQSLTLC